MRQKVNILKKTITILVFALTGFLSAWGQTPLANFTGNPTAGCSPLVVNFTDQSTGNPTSWSWDFGNGATSTLQNPTTTFFTPGTYTIKLTVTNAAGSNTLTRSQYITVYEPPTVNFSGNPTSGCFPLRVQFTDLSNPGAGNNNVAWLWDFGNGTQSTAQNPFVTFNTAGNFTVTLKVTNDKGCIKVLSRPNYIQIPNGVVAAFSSSLPASCTPPSTISFTNTSTGPGTLSYNWDFGDGGNSASQNPSHTFLTGGAFVVTLVTISSAGCIDTLKDTVHITNNITAITAPDSVCVNAPVNFINGSTPTPLSNAWDFGDGGTSLALNPTKTYTTVGVYNVKLVNDYGNCLDSVVKPITVLARPVADFTAPVTTRCQPPLTVNFQNNSANGVSWQWNFGDGGTSTQQNPSHTYNAYGLFDVTLIATNAFGCTDTIVKPQFVKIARPVITIPAMPAKGCVPYLFSPVANIVAMDVITSYFWDFGDGATSNLQNPSHTYVAQGTYTVKLVITSSSGCTDSLVVPGGVRVGTKPTANFTAAPSPVCAYQTVQFTDLTPPPVDEWHWDFGDGGTSLIQNPGYQYSDTGFFSVTLVAVNNGCPDTILIPNIVYVKPPIAKFDFAGSCSNRFFFTFTDRSIGPVTTWAWDFGDGTTSAIPSPTHTFPALGNYNVSLTVSNGGCTHTLTQVVHVVNENPDFLATPAVACKPAQIVFNVQNVTTANIDTFYWDFGNATQYIGTGTTTYTSYPNSGTYSITLITTDVNGCKDTVTKPNYVRINGPIANFTAVNTSGCKGLTTLFNDLSASDGLNAITNWQWDFGDGVVQNFSGPPFQHTYNTAGTFSVKLRIRDAAGCTDSLLQTNIIITTDPNPQFFSADTVTCPGGMVHFTNQSVALNFSSLWDFGDGTTSNGSSPIHAYATTGLYTVKLYITDQYGCTDSIVKPNYVRVARPIASFTISDSASACTPFEVDFTNTSQFYTFTTWDLGNGGQSLLTNPTVYYNVPGTYIATLYVYSPGGCVDSAKRTIYVYDTTGSRISYSPLNGCKPVQIDLQATTNNPVTYIWDYGDGNVDSTLTPNVSHVYNTYGDFIPKVILKDPSGCLIPITGPDTVHIMGAVAKFGFDNRFFCDSGMVHFVDSTSFNNTVIFYNWDFGDGSSSNLQNPNHQYSIAGAYTVTLTVNTVGGCLASLTLPDTIKIVRSPLIDIAGDTSVCVNDPMLLSGLFLRADTSAVGWAWTFPNGHSSTIQNPPQQVYVIPGNYVVSAIAVNSSGCKDSTLQNIVVHPLPTATLPGTMTTQAGFPVTLPATYSPGVNAYLWTPANTLNCATCPQPIASPKFNTTYNVTFTDSNGCRNSSEIVVIVICKDANVFVPNTFSPNGDGVNDVFYPRGRGINRVKTLRIFNRWGEVIFESKDFPINDPNFGWNGKYKGFNAQPGVYIYQVEFYCDNGDIIRFDGNVSLIL